MTRPLSNRRGSFTLLELLVVVAIIMLLAALLLPALRTARWSAQKAVCASNLRQLGMGIHQYAADFSEQMPALNTAWDMHYLLSGPVIGGTYQSPQLNAPCFATLYHKGYVPNRHVFYDPAYWCTDPDPAFTGPESGWPAYGASGNFCMGYMWVGGYNLASCQWALVWGNLAVSISMVRSSGVCDGPLYTAPLNPQWCRPLFCRQLEQTTGGVPYLRDYAHALNGNRTGINAWYLDGHVEFGAAARQGYQNFGGPYAAYAPQSCELGSPYPPPQ